MRRLHELLKPLSDFDLFGSPDPATLLIQQITFDSRTIGPGSLFVALDGRRLDGHRFIPAVIEQGAVAIVGTKSPAALAEQGIVLPVQIVYVQVADSRVALAYCCAAWHVFPSKHIAVIGATGTDGKTTTCSLIESILAQATQSTERPAGRVGVITTVAARIGGVASDTGLHVTTPDAPDVQRYLAQMLEAGCQYAVIESTSHGLNQARVAAVDFDIAAVTNITHEHLDEHGTRDAYVAAKAKLFRALYHTPAKAGVPRCAVLNADDVGSFAALQAVIVEEAAQSTTQVALRSYGIAGQAAQPGYSPDVTANDIVYAPDGTHFAVHWWDGKFQLTSPLIGEFNVSNVLCAATVALALGVTPTAIQRAIASFPGVLGRMERLDRGQPFLALVDFAHTPDSLERALLTLRKLVGAQGRLIAVFGSAGLRDRAKRYLMGKVSGRLADFTIVTAEDPRTEDLAEINAEIARGVREFTDERHFVIVPDRTAAIQQAVDMAQTGDVVAAFGKGHERSMCFGTIEYPWSDQAALAAALEQRMAQGR